MYVLGNPILGKNFRWSSLVLNEKGLHKLVRVDLGKRGVREHRFPLTDDVDKILALLQLKLEDINDKPIEEAYEVLTECVFFRLDKFIGDQPEKSKELEDFRLYLLKQDEIWVEQTRKFDVSMPIRTTMVEEILGLELRDKIDHIKNVLTNSEKAYQQKFNAMKVLLLEDGYVPQNFSKDLPKFKAHFGDSFGFMEGMLMNTTEELFEIYKKVSE